MNITLSPISAALIVLLASALAVQGRTPLPSGAAMATPTATALPSPRILLMGAGEVTGATRGRQFTTLDATQAVPGKASGTRATGINQQGDVVGAFWRDDGHHGFLLHRGRYATFDHPRAATGRVPGTHVTGINDQRYIVGYVHTSSFLLYQERYLSVLDPKAGSAIGSSTLANGINNQGDIVGCFTRGWTPATRNEAATHGFLLRRGHYVTLDDPKALKRGATCATGMNDYGDTVGYYFPNERTVLGFLLHRGRYVTLAHPPAMRSVLPNDINDRGDVVGQYMGRDGHYHGFLWKMGRYTTIDAPRPVNGNFASTWAYGTNDRGDVVGAYDDGTRMHGFLWHRVPSSPSSQSAQWSRSVSGAADRDENHAGHARETVIWSYQSSATGMHAVW